MEINRTEVVELIRNVGIAGNFNALEHDALLRENGVDSLDMANILLSIAEKYSVKIPDEDIEKLDTINAIVKYLFNKQAWIDKIM